jgi:hypothetical protein
MPDSSSIRAGKAYVEVTAKDSTAQELTKIGANVAAFGKRLSAIGKGLSIAGAAITAPLIAAAKISADAGAKLYDMSRRTGVAASKLSAFGYAADQTGASIDNVETSIKLMQKSIGRLAAEEAAPQTMARLRKEMTDAAAAADGAVGSLTDIGVSMADLRGKNPGEQFEIIAGKIAAIKDPTARAAAALKVFGRSGTDILPMIERLGELQAEAKRFGFVKSDATIAAAKQMSVAFDLVTKATGSLWNALSTALYPTLQAKAQVVFRAALLARDWAKSHQEIVVTAFKVGTALLVAGAGMVAVGKALQITGPLLRLVGPAFGLIGTALSAILSPLGLVSVGLVAAGAAFIYFSGVGAKVATFLSGMWPGIVADAQTAIGGIADAMKAGDWGLAAKIGALEIAQIWMALKFAAAEIFSEIGNAIVAAQIKAAASAKVVWLEFKDWFAKLTNYLGDTAVVTRIESQIKQQSQVPADASPQEREARTKRIAELQEQLKDAKRQRDLGQSEPAAETQAQIDAITKKRDADLAALKNIGDDGSDASYKSYQDAIAEAEEELRKLRQKAKDEANSPDAHNYDLPTDFPDTPNPQDLSDTIAEASRRAFASRGTFNASAAQSLSGNSAVDRTAKATEETAKNTKTLIGKFASGFAVNYQP